CVTGNESMIPKNDTERAAAHQRIRNSFRRRFASTADKYRSKLIEIYGRDKGSRIKCAEAFELCEYGRRPSTAELKRMFLLAER
ncbi:MAG: hypothetical protein JSU94_05725, partial [Phycisphaerales bacterium]